MPSFPLKRAFNILDREDQRKLIFITLIQIMTGFFDLAGVFIIGALAALSIQGIEAAPAGNKTGKILRVFHIENFSFQNQIAFLGAWAGGILILKTLISIYFTKKTFRFLSHKSAEVSNKLISKLLSQNILYISERSSQEILYILSQGIESIMLGLVATSLAILSDFAMLIIILIGLLLIDPWVAMITLLIFVATGFILNMFLRTRAQLIGFSLSKLIIRTNQKILEVLKSYRELTIHDRRHYYIKEISDLKHNYATLQAENTFMPYISKYVVESVTVFGTLILAGLEFGTKNAVHSVAILSIFLAASSRIAPALLRIQQGSLTVRNSVGASEGTFVMMEELKRVSEDSKKSKEPNLDYVGFDASLELISVSFSYPKNNNFRIERLNIKLQAGETLAIVGPSGAGKSTLVDLILGIYEPDAGIANISNMPSSDAINYWPGAISYVPQDIAISAGTIRSNIGLGYPKEFITDQMCWDALYFANLSEVVSKLPDKLDFRVGENGEGLSGGQRQRLGIARAMFTSPKLIVFDEATSALDAQTEDLIASSIRNLKGKVTVIVVAHRLSTVRSVDKVLYMAEGKLVAVGSFEEVRQIVPNFDQQASLMGI